MANARVTAACQDFGVDGFNRCGPLMSLREQPRVIVARHAGGETLPRGQQPRLSQNAKLPADVSATTARSARRATVRQT